jgi:hypothetical protein
MNRVSEIILLLNGKKISHKRGTYHCETANQSVVVFSETDTTGRVMLPTDMVLEWIQAYEFGIIKTEDKARAMRLKVVDSSRWAPFQHGFETHLAAIVAAWAARKDSRKSVKARRSRGK